MIILSVSVGMQHGQPVQVNVVQQVTTTAGSPSIPVQIPVFDLPLDNDGSRPQNQRQSFNQSSSPSKCIDICYIYSDCPTKNFNE